MHDGETALELRFKGVVIYWRGPSPFYFVEIPRKQSEEIKRNSKDISYGWGVIPVSALALKVEWSTSLFPKGGLYLLPLKNVVRKSLKVDTGDILSVIMKLGK